MKKRILFSALLCIAIISGCSVEPSKVTQPEPFRQKKAPFIRIGIMQTNAPVAFTLTDRAKITNFDGSFIARGLRSSTWQAGAEVSSPSLYFYVLVAGSMSTSENAEAMALNLKKQGFSSFILPVKTGSSFSANSGQQKTLFRVCLDKKFTTREEAAAYKEQIENRLDTFIIKQKIKSAAGTISLKNMITGQVFESAGPIYISESNITIHDIIVGKGFHWESKKTRTYPEKICLQLDNQGRLAVINILPVEEYLKGVLPSEMPRSFPLEALKAQAVAARSEALAKFGRAHRDDPFDLCADVHCQVYSGTTQRTKRTDKAVSETRGLVLWKNGEICDAVYSAVCGGHTEDSGNVWGGLTSEYLQGRYDGPPSVRKKYGSLQNERNIRQWLNDVPAAYCNSTGNVPPSLNYTKKYFRWTKELTQQEIRASIEKYAGRSIGNIVDLQVLSRGVSGRIVQMTVKGTAGEILLNRELKIRKALCTSTLWSSCFIVEKKDFSGGIPGRFILKGAGFGHGVGMCQTGAARIAIKKGSFMQILNHYYKGARLKRLY